MAAPIIESFTPANGATGHDAGGGTLIWDYDQSISQGDPSTRAYLHDFDTDAVLYTMDPTDSNINIGTPSIATISGIGYPNGKKYYVTADEGFFENGAEEPSAAIVKGDWVFETLGYMTPEEIAAAARSRKRVGRRRRAARSRRRAG